MSTADVFQRVDATLLTARFGFEDLQNPDPRRKLAGLRNLIVFGRAVTNVLQNLRSTTAGFEEWYKEKVKEMRDDPLLRRFYELRTEILKKGGMETERAVHIRSLRLPDDLQRMGPPPPNAGAFFMGDGAGGAGWEIRQPDGSLEKFYVALPADIGTIDLVLRDSPTHHLGQQLPQLGVEALAELYFRYLDRLIDEAKKKFLVA